MEAPRRALRLALCVVGIWGSYVTQGIVQENLSTKLYNGSRFQHLAALQLAQCLACFAWSFLMLLFVCPKQDAQAPLWAYWSASITNSVGPACGIQALKYISYPAQVLAKSSKMIPVMFMGAFLYGVRYTIPEYICTFLVAGGVSAFAIFKGSTKVSKVASPNAPLGYGLCCLNLMFDGFTNATQDSIKSRFPKTNAWHIMMGMNFWGSIYMGLYMFGWGKGGGYEALEFCRQHPEAALDILWFCLCGAVGQNFIFLTISWFGTLTTTTITTTRKFVSILVSTLWRGNPLMPPQWLGVLMVFAGLSSQILLKWRKQRTKTTQRKKSA